MQEKLICVVNFIKREVRIKKIMTILLFLTFSGIYLLVEANLKSISEIPFIDPFGEELSRNNEWINMNPDNPPTPRWSYGMTYDSGNNVCIVFGGQDGQQEFDDTWVYNFNENEWTNMNPVLSPPSRFAHRMVYNCVDSIVVLFGGVSAYERGFVYNDTWTYNFTINQWIEMSPTQSPPARAYLGMDYNESENVVVLFGGYNYLTYQWFSDTWIYNFSENTWTNMNPSPNPGYRNNLGMTYDKTNDVIILFGGWYSTSMLGDTWIYNLNTNEWTDMNPVSAPPPIYQHGMTYDIINSKAVVFGGFFHDTMTYSNSTWVYDLSTNNWENPQPATYPPARGKHRLVYDNNNHNVVLFGGFPGGPPYNDTWIYVPPYPDIEVYPESLLFVTDESLSDSITIENSGTSDLNIFEINYSEPWIISIEPISFSISPNDSTFVTIVVNGEGLLEGEYIDCLSILSNDPDEPEIDLPVTLQVPTGVDEELTNPSNDLFLYQNYPNPFNPETHITFYLSHPGEMKLEIYNVTGQKIRTLISGLQTAGEHSIVWKGRDDNGNVVSSGIYFYRLESDDTVKIQKAILMK
jgi:hypothetical protein